MADIIRLADRRSQAPQTPLKDGPTAQLLLFTGVRYERLDPPSRRPGSKRPTKSRKRG
ncbi:MAG: hypothetical protein ABWY49_08240 [Rhizobium sp.]